MQLMQKRLRSEYYRLYILDKKQETNKFVEKKERNFKFYIHNDLYSIKDLNEIDILINGSLNVKLEESQLEPDETDMQEDELQNQSDISSDESEFYEEDHDDLNETYSDTEEKNDSNENEQYESKTTYIERDYNNDFLVYQIEDIQLNMKDINSVKCKNWLTDSSIEAFMKTYQKEKNVLVLNYHKTTQMIHGLLETNDQFSSIFQKVNYLTEEILSKLAL